MKIAMMIDETSKLAVPSVEFSEVSNNKEFASEVLAESRIQREEEEQVRE